MTKLKADMASPEVKAELEKSKELAKKMGVNGTPHFLVGDRAIPGAPENSRRALKARRRAPQDRLQRLLSFTGRAPRPPQVAAHAARRAGCPGRPSGLPPGGKAGRRVSKVRSGPPSRVPSAALEDHGEADLRPQRTQPQHAGLARACDLRA